MKPRTCYRDDGKHKMAFSTRRLAKEKVRKGQHIYHCPNCTFFHIASDH